MAFGKAAAALLCACALQAQAAVVWDEAADGDLADDGQAPSVLVFGAGSNRVIGTTGNGAGGFDPDYFSFTVPVGGTLSAITLLDNTVVSGSVSFVAISAHPTIDQGNFLAFTHYGPDLIGFDLLPFLTGLDALPSGTYSIWVQETGGTADYGFDFEIAAVPLPAPLALLAAGLAGMGFSTRSARGAPKQAHP